MRGNNHWVITPNLVRSIQIDSWSGGPKSYLWQPVIAAPVIQQTKMEELQTAGFRPCWASSVWRTDGNCWMTGCFCIHGPQVEVIIQ